MLIFVTCEVQHKRHTINSVGSQTIFRIVLITGILFVILTICQSFWDLLCGLVVRVPGYRSRSTGFDSRSYQILWEVEGLERRPLSLMSTIEELLGRNSSCSGRESREYGRRDPSRWPRGTLYPQTLALTSPTRGSRSIGIVSSRSLVLVNLSVTCEYWIIRTRFRVRQRRPGCKDIRFGSAISLSLCLSLSIILDADYRLLITWIIHQQLWGYTVEEKLHLGVREQKRLNTSGLEQNAIAPRNECAYLAC
jgi:hypothetical protein